MKQIDTEVSPLIHESLQDSFDIKSMGHILENIQESVANVTGIAFVTVDYKGDVITEKTHFCNYCQSMRDDPKRALLCKLSDASGAIIAATNKKVSIYVCPCGLLEIAIPIIINGQYLGGFIGGQILCRDIPDSIVRLSKNMVPGGSDLVDHHVDHASEEVLSDIKQYSYHEVESIANLVELIIHQLTSHELISNQNKQKNLAHIAQLKEKNKKICREKDWLYSDLMSYKRRVAMMTDRNMLNVISNLSIIEDAPKTYAAFMDYIQIIGAKAHRLDDSNIEEEIKKIRAFIALANERSQGRIHCHIEAEGEVLYKQIPMYSLLAYIQSLVYYLLDTEEEAIHISIYATVQAQDIRIVIEDDSLLLKPKELDRLNGASDTSERRSQSLGNILDTTRIINSLEDLKEALNAQYQDEYELVIRRINKRGLQVLIEYPAVYGEEVRYD